MIFSESILPVKDNSGISLVKTIKILNKSPKKHGKLGDLLVVSIQKIKPTKKLKKGNVCKAILIQTKKNIIRNNGHFVSFDNNLVIIINDKFTPFATRSKNVSLHFFKDEKYSKINSIIWSGI